MIAVGKREGYCCRLHRRNADSDGDDDESLKHSKSFMMSRSIGNRTQSENTSETFDGNASSINLTKGRHPRDPRHLSSNCGKIDTD